MKNRQGKALPIQWFGTVVYWCHGLGSTFIRRAACQPKQGLVRFRSVLPVSAVGDR